MSTSGSKADSYSRLIDFVYHSTLGFGVIKKKREETTVYQKKKDSTVEEEGFDTREARLAAGHAVV